jgi:hypothetical protein
VTHLQKRAAHVVVVSPPCVDEPGRLLFQRRKYGEDAFGALDRSNENTAKYAAAAKSVAESAGVAFFDAFEITTAALCSTTVAEPRGSLGTDSVDPRADLGSRSARTPSVAVFENESDAAEALFADGVHFTRKGQDAVFVSLMRFLRETFGADLDADAMDPDWPFGPVLRTGDPAEWREKMRAHRGTMRIKPALRRAAGRSGLDGTFSAEADAPKPREEAMYRRGCFFRVLGVAGIGLGVGYALGSRR